MPEKTKKMKTMTRNNQQQYKTAKTLGRITFLFFYFFILLFFSTSCSEDDGDTDEFENWQQRNEAFFASLADSMMLNPSQWVKYKNYSLDEQTLGKTTDYIYAKVITRGEGTESPMYTDSVRVSYQGRLIPSVSYPEGFVFDGTVYKNEPYDDRTNATVKLLISQTADGFATALLHMHRGDYWRVFIPSDLAYGDNGNGNTIPGHSVIIFDLTLHDFASAGEPMAVWSARRR